MFSVHATPDDFKSATIARHFGFAFEEKLDWSRKSLISNPDRTLFDDEIGRGRSGFESKKSHIVTPSILKSCGFKIFSVPTKIKSRRLQIPLV